MSTMADKSFNLIGRKLMIAIPCYDGKVNIRTAFAIAELVPKLDKMGVRLNLVHMSGCSIITKARNKLVRNFMESDCTDFLFVDADVVINTDAVTRLLALSSDKDVVAGSYPRRSKDAKFFLDFYLDKDGQLEFDDHGLMRVESVSTGFMLIRRHVIEHMIEKHPEWQYAGDGDGETEHALFDFMILNGQYIGEDYAFCLRARQDGFKIYLDPMISLPHIGTEEFTRDFEKDVLRPLLKEHAKPQLKVANG
jgi:NDP-sugar pyrophosphorylase family protein